MNYFTNRLEKIKLSLNQNNLDGIIITNLKNIRYISGFSGSSATCLIINESEYFISDGRYKIQSEIEVKNMEIFIDDESNFDIIKKQKLINNKKLKLGFESDKTTHDELQSLKLLFPQVNWVPIINIIENISKIKDKQEIQCIRQAVEITDEVFDQIIPDLRIGLNEKEIAAKISFALKILGADEDAFRPIVAGGPNSALPHAFPSSRELQKGDFLILDFGAKYNGYHADMTRTVVIKECSEKQKEIYNIVSESQKLGIKNISDNTDCKYIDSICRDYIKNSGYGDNFIHSTGHGLGLEIHENPRFSKNSKDKIYSNYIMTVEPGIYIPNLGGVRIEDDVIVKKTNSEILNKSTKELIVID
tara:strand:+ start:1541 stop:2623 length:1083 start_codon:yes stop_codon:yes gene_type:complete